MNMILIIVVRIELYNRAYNIFLQNFIVLKICNRLFQP